MNDLPLAAAAVFWTCLLLIAYTYLIYPVLLLLAYSLVQARRDWCYAVGRRNRRTRDLASRALPPVSLVIAAYNEERHLEEKLRNLRALDYPRDRLQVIFVSDGSADATNRMLAEVDEPWVQTIFLPRRGGKSQALNQGVERARHPILVFSDAATLIGGDALGSMVKHFLDPRVGVVCGALQFQGSQESKQTEGLYWKYECILRLMEGRLGATLTASGAFYALRRECYTPLPAQTLIEDFVIPMKARKLGYQVLYDPEATAVEFAAETVAGEFTRRVRLAMGSFRALPVLLSTPMDFHTRLAFLSHKLLRWMVPFLLIGLAGSNLFLLDEPIYFAALAGQALFYVWAGLGVLFRRRLQGVRFALVPYFLMAMNLAFLVGFARCFLNRNESTWQRVN